MAEFIVFKNGKIQSRQKERQEPKSDGKKHRYVVMSGIIKENRYGDGLVESFQCLEEYDDFESAKKKWRENSKMEFNRIEYYIDGSRVGRIEPM